MAINVTAANCQAAEIVAKITQLRNARNQLYRYRSELQENWQGQEVGLFVERIEAEIAKIDALMGNLNSLSSDIRRVAEAIHREEEAAARAAEEKAARERQAAQARNAYNQACDALDTIVKERNSVIQQMRNTKSMKTMSSLNLKLIDIDKRISEAQERCDQFRLALG